MVTLRQIAARAGVSLATASRALAGQEYVAASTRDRVKRIADELGYVPNVMARDLRRNPTRTIGFLVPDLRYSSFASDASALIQNHLLERGYSMVMCATRHDRETELRCLQWLRDQRVDGIIHVPGSSASAKDVAFGPRPIPVVEFLRCSDAGKLDAVVYDDELAAKTVVEYLLNLGHRRIGLICGPEEATSTKRRLSGSRRAIVECGDGAKLTVAHGEYWPETGRIAMHRFMSQPKRPTAVFASSTQFVLGGMLATKELGLSIPADLSLMAFGDPQWGQIISPALTTYSLPLQEMAMTVNLMIMSRVERPQDGERGPVQVTIDGNVVVRQSTAPPH
jgi:DNA-binding LacI/PurR family transcriptional regulator